MSQGPFLFLALAAGIAVVVIATTRYKVHPFLALILTAYAMGFCGGLPLTLTLPALTDGFGKTLSQIGIVIACGCMVGVILERSGCAVVMANTAIRLMGRERALQGQRWQRSRTRFFKSMDVV